MDTALLLIDIQNDYFPAGRMELEGSEQAGQAAGDLLQAFRAAKLPIIHVQHVSERPGSTFFLPGTEGARLHHCVAPHEGEPVFVKHFPSAFRETKLQQHCRDRAITHLVVAGMMTHMCVDTTVRAAFDLGFACTLAHDACAAKALTFNGQSVAAELVQRAYMAALHGMFADVRTVRDICAALCCPAGV